MTSPAAVAAILVLLDGTVAPADMIAFSPEIALMTGGAEGRVLGRRPRYRTVLTITVAPGTPWIPSVVARIVPLRVMAEAGRRPAVGRMTDVALYVRG